MVPEATRKSGPYTGNSVATSFAFDFKVFAKADLRVVRTVISTGADTDLVLDSDYSVTLNADQDVDPGGSVTYPLSGAAMANTHKLTLVGDMTVTQPTDITNLGGFYPQVIEDALDRAVMLIGQQQETIDRSFRLPVSVSSDVSAELPSPEANTFLVWNEDANALQNADPSTIATVVAFGTARSDIFSGDGVTTAFTLSANPGAQNNLDVSIGGVTQNPGDDYVWSSSTTITFTSAPPAGTRNVLCRYMEGLPIADAQSAAYTPAGTGAVETTIQAKLRQFVTVTDFGAKGDNSTNDTAAIQAAIDSLGANGGTVWLPTGMYLISSPLLITTGQVSLRGMAPAWFAHTGGTTIRQTSANTDIVRITGASTSALADSNMICDMTLCHGITAVDDTNTSGIGIKITNALRTTVDNCIILGMQKGISINYLINGTFTRNKIQRVYAVPTGAHYGIYLEDDGTHLNASNTYRDNIIASIPSRTGTFTGVYYSGSALQDQFFENTEVTFCDVGFSLTVSAPTVQYDIKIHKCVIDSYTNSGIALAGFTNSGGVDIIGGWIAPSSAPVGAVYGIQASNCVGIKILGIEFVGVSNVTNANALGIYLSTCADCQIIGNRFRDVFYHLGADGLTKSTIIGNSFKQSSATAAGAFIILNSSSNDNVIVGNIFNAASSSGRAVWFLSGNNNQQTQNVFKGTYSTAQITDAIRSKSIANALNSDLSLTPNGDYVEFTGGGASAQLGGIVAGYDGQEISILNGTGSAISIVPASASSSAANRILTSALATVTWNDGGIRQFKYTASVGRWILMGSVAA